MKILIKNNIRLKFALILLIIFIVSGTVLFALINQVFTSNLENTIQSSMKDIMKNSRYYIFNNNLRGKDLSFDEKTFNSQVSDIVSYFEVEYSCDVEIRNTKGDIIASTITTLTQNSQLIELGVKAAKKGRSIINLSYNGNDVNAVLSYPLFFNDKCVGILSISKSYGDLYVNNKRLLNIIFIIEVFIFIVIFIFTYGFTSRTLRPLAELTKNIKKLEEGDFGISIKTKRSDEIGILIEEFMKMKYKIKAQMDTINMENDKILKLESSRRGFFNNATHELKTPLTAISGYAQLLSSEKELDEEFKKRAVERIIYESERLHNLVIDLIEASKNISSLDEDVKIIDMQKIISEICNDMEMKGNKYSITIRRNIEKGTIMGKENKLRQVVINILDNAIKYSFNGGKIYVKAFNKGGFYTLEISNKGEIISNEIYDNIFEPFVSGGNKVEPGSSGLGLYICKEIIKEHDGEIYIENGEKIKVIVKLPSRGNNLETS